MTVKDLGAVLIIFRTDWKGRFQVKGDGFRGQMQRPFHYRLETAILMRALDLGVFFNRWHYRLETCDW
jgi:hypothetical protein